MRNFIYLICILAFTLSVNAQKLVESDIPRAVKIKFSAGCERVVKSADECLAIEPALRESTVPIVGGTYTAQDESGDAHRFARALAERCAARGVAFRYGTTVESMPAAGDRIEGTRLAGGETLKADAVVVALGSFSPLLLKSLGVNILVYPDKGYSVTIPVAADNLAPMVSLTDDGHRIVFSRLGDRLRVAGTAEFAGWDMSVKAARCEAIVRRVFAIFPRCGDRSGIETWAGLRPL